MASVAPQASVAALEIAGAIEEASYKIFYSVQCSLPKASIH